MKELIKLELSPFLSPLFLLAAYDSWSSKEQRGELEWLGLERDMVIFASQIPVVLYSMDESSDQPVVCKEWEGYSAEF